MIKRRRISYTIRKYIFYHGIAFINYYVIVLYVVLEHTQRNQSCEQNGVFVKSGV